MEKIERKGMKIIENKIKKEENMNNNEKKE